MTPKVSIIMGSTSDLKIMEEAAKFFDEMEIPYEINALSAHRVPELVMDFAKTPTKGALRWLLPVPAARLTCPVSSLRSPRCL